MWAGLLAVLFLGPAGCRSKPSALTVYRKAVELAAAGRFREAIPEYETALALARLSRVTQPIARRSLLGLATLHHLRLRDPTGGERFYRRLVRAYPGTPEALVAGERLVDLLEHLARNRLKAAEAAAALLARLPRGSRQRRWRLRLAALYVSLRRDREATAAAKVLLMDPGARAQVKRAALVLLGDLERRKGRCDRAVRHYRGAVGGRMGGPRYLVRLDLARCLLSLGKGKEVQTVLAPVLADPKADRWALGEAKKMVGRVRPTAGPGK